MYWGIYQKIIIKSIHYCIIVYTIVEGSALFFPLLIVALGLIFRMLNFIDWFASFPSFLYIFDISSEIFIVNIFLTIFKRGVYKISLGFVNTINSLPLVGFFFLIWFLKSLFLLAIDVWTHKNIHGLSKRINLPLSKLR